MIHAICVSLTLLRSNTSGMDEGEYRVGYSLW